ncbi:MAG TPA: alpha-amylase family protein [Tepidisphaeraceae bacterium]|jgi:hypothetical protein|nr:alpha-amylase family protein [Tepidisphaeraceae bacterium]
MTADDITVPALARRQVHLDFHTSEYIEGVAGDFDAPTFARTMREAHVDSVTLFAKCHHGMSYYPTAVGTRHPHLAGGRDLLGEQLQALRSANIRTPVYTTVGWDEDVASRFPQWRQMRRDGTFAQLATSADGRTRQPGGWRFNDFAHADYLDYIEAHVRELAALYGDAIDGFFFDIVFYDEDAAWSPAAVALRARHGLCEANRGTHARVESIAQAAFAERFTRVVRGLLPRATVFYNTPNPLSVDARYGVKSRHPHQTHWELESLPSGFWGYQHFPRLARAVDGWGKPWLAMTGRFQKMWGDFGGLKPRAALEFECFRSQALGGANSVGDQLHPRGVPDASTYRLIGDVYAQCRAAEPFYAGSSALPQVGIVLPTHPDVDPIAGDKSLEGAVGLCEELHYECVVLDDGVTDVELARLDLVILPDSSTITDTLAARLATYRAGGGRLLASFRGATDVRGDWVIPSMPLSLAGTVARHPTFWRTRDGFAPELAGGDRVHYAAGLNVVAGAGVQVLIDRAEPYFNRTDLTFCSHFHTPAEPVASKYAAALAGEGFIYFADPVFREYRQTGNTAVRAAVAAAFAQLIGPPQSGAGLPCTVLVVPRRRGRDLLLTLLHYVPVRKAIDIDVIQEPSTFAGEKIRLPERARVVRSFKGQALERTAEGSFALPPSRGRLLLEVPDYFAD